MRVKNAEDVWRWRLCVGCGACLPLCPSGNIRLVNRWSDGIRPESLGKCEGCGKCLSCCPGLGYIGGVKSQINGSRQTIPKGRGFGGFLEIWEGHVASESLRKQTSSGGLVTALSLCALGSRKSEKVFHVKQEAGRPFENVSAVSTSHEEVVKASGSRYAPSSPCDRLKEIVDGSGKSVFVGKPCDIGAIAEYCRSIGLDRDKWPILLGFFCAGAPSSDGTRKLLEKNGVDPGRVSGIRYRGNGWPGDFTAIDNSGKALLSLDYETSWGFLQAYRPFRCYLCPDGTAECADISLGDAWYKKGQGGDGLSLAIVRTERGRELFRKALDSGEVEAVRVGPEEVLRSQENLLGKRRSLFGRILTLKAMGIPAPKYKGFDLFGTWRKSPFDEKLKSVFGTARRAISRGYFKKIKKEKLSV